MSTTTIAPTAPNAETLRRATYGELVSYLHRSGYLDDPEYKRIARLAASRSDKARRLDQILQPIVAEMSELGTAEAAAAAKVINKRICRAYRAASLTLDALSYYRETWLDARGYPID